MLEFNSSPSFLRTYIAPYYNLFSGFCSVYYRQTNNNTIVNQVSSDVNLAYPSIDFRPYQVLVVTYNCPDHSFQMALATNGTDSFAVMNYERLMSDPRMAGMNEYGCGTQEFFPANKGSTIAIAVNVTGVRGRHVYNLTKKGCFEPVYGVKNLRDQFFRLYSLFNNRAKTLNVLNPGEIGNYSLNLIEIVTGGEVPVSIVLFSLPRPSSQIGAFTVYYGMYHASSSYSYYNAYTNNLFIYQGTKKSPTFQYGNISITKLGLSTLCRTHLFEQSMISPPSIKISAITTSVNVWNDFVFIWLKGVTDKGFTVCLREIINYSGDRDISISYVAVSATDSNIAEVNSLLFPASSQIQRCVVKKFNNVFLAIPHLYTSVEVFGGSDEPMMSWVKSITLTQAEICLKSTRNEQHKIHMIISGQISACTNYSCPDHLECQLTLDQEPYCGCIRNCSGEEQREFCGSDFLTYTSMCDLRQRHCQRYGNTSEMNVVIKHYGKCQCKFRTNLSAAVYGTLKFWRAQAIYWELG